jgi:hypothetical protein
MTLRSVIAIVALATLGPATMAARAARAQDVAEHLAIGDRERDASHALAALRHYEAALAAEPRRYDALWKAASAAVDAGEEAVDAERRLVLYRLGEGYARRAVAADSSDAEGHFALARALGRTALSLGARDRVRYAAEVRAHALDALRIDPRHAGALHVMGAWNAAVMRLNGVERFMARKFLGGRVFGTASWREALRYMEQSVAIAPHQLVHRVALAEIYADVGDNAKAREQTDLVAHAPTLTSSDARYKRQAERLARELK